jgi:hemoglobin
MLVSARHTFGVEITSKLPDESLTVYDAVGGMPFFEQLAAGFYRQVATDDVLLQLYPDPHDLEPAALRLQMFLAQYWGGPTTYSEERGHPRLRMRHAPYAIGETEQTHWLRAMLSALSELETTPDIYERFVAYFTMSAEAMRNQ